MVEKEIRVKDLVIGYLQHWRSILLVMLLGGILMGILGYIKDVNDEQKNKTRVMSAEANWEVLYGRMQNGETLSEEEMLEFHRLEELISGVTVAEVKLKIGNVILGMVFCVGIYAVAYLLFYSYNSKIMITDDFQELYEISHLGSIYEKKKSTRLFGKIDDILLFFRDDRNRKPLGVHALNRTYKIIKALIEEYECEKVFFVGCEIKGHSAYICKQLQGVIERKGIDVTVLSSINSTEEIIWELENAEFVILVELTGQSRYDKVTQEIELLKEHNANIVGGIIVG